MGGEGGGEDLETPSVKAFRGAETTVLSRSGQLLPPRPSIGHPRSRISTIGRWDSAMRRNWTGDTVRLPHQKQIITNERPRVASTSGVPGLRLAINTHRLPSTKLHYASRYAPAANTRIGVPNDAQRSVIRSLLCPLSLSLFSVSLFPQFFFPYHASSSSSFIPPFHSNYISIMYIYIYIHTPRFWAKLAACFFSRGGWPAVDKSGSAGIRSPL